MTEWLHTPRLRLRLWRSTDLPAFAALNADPKVMRYFSSTLSRQESNALAARIEAHIQHHGFGFWAIEAPNVADFIGFAGLARPRFQAHFTPCVEIGWRLAQAYWGQGYATEAARAALHEGFTTFGLDEIVSFTAATNTPSRRIMEKLGMQHNPADDFEHPSLPPGHPLRPHALYRLSSEAWEAFSSENA